MAYQTGTVDNYRQLLKTFVDFVTTDTGVAAEGGNWAINRGRISDQAVDYLDDTSYGENGKLEWDRAIAMGDDDDWSDQTLDDHYAGWRAYSTDLPNGSLGYESTVAVLPASYKITAVDWSTDIADEHPETWFLEYSDNGTTWLEGDDVSTAGGGTYGDQTSWTKGQVRTFTVPTGLGTHKYWRLRFVTNNGDATYLSIGRLRFYNSTPDWISYSYSNEIQLEAPGLTGTEEIYMGIRLVEDPVNDYFNWELMGAIGYDDAGDFRHQPFTHITNSGTAGQSYVTLYDQELKYWLCANGQRAVMVVKVSTVYVSLYMGKYLPYATPSQHPYPVVITGGSYYYNKRWSDETGYVGGVSASIVNGGGSHIFCSNNTWTPLGARGYNGFNTSADTPYVVYAHCAHRCFASDSSNFSNVLPNPDGSHCILPLMLISYYATLPDNALLGEIEGVFWVSGNSNISENIITIDAQDYLVFQNIYRTEWNDYAVLELK